jgi:hypothetical protein
VAPVALGVQIADVEAFLQAELDRRDGAGDLARDEGLAPNRALVVEQDAVRNGVVSRCGTSRTLP